jgi:uncharacterized protein YeaO (DUF488 family)
MAIRTKSVKSPIDRENDGLRILAARSTGMFLPKSRYDVWMPNLGPSESLRARLKRHEVSWERYLEIYEEELTRERGWPAQQSAPQKSWPAVHAQADQEDFPRRK